MSTLGDPPTAAERLRKKARSYRRAFNRWELKYRIAQSTIPAITGALEPYAVVDPHAPSEHGYRTHSVYCDTPDLQFFWEKVEGEKFRRKFRFRRYENQPDTFLEIKQRISQTVQKRRVRWPLDRVRAVFLEGQPTEATVEELGDPVTAEILLLWRTCNLSPRMATYYRRLALHGRRDPGLRITFDTAVQYSAHALDVSEPFTGGKPLIDPRQCVLEIKFNDRAPEWLGALVSRFGLHKARFSKYCGGVDRQWFGNRFT